MNKLSLPLIRKGLKYITLEYSFVAVYVALTYGYITILFAKELGATDFQVGILSSLFFLTMVFKIPTAYFIEKAEKRKDCVFIFVGLEIILKSTVFLIPFIVKDTGTAVLILIIMTALAHIFSSIGNTAWLPWLADIIPQKVRGRFLGKVHMISQAFSILAIYFAGWCLDKFSNNFMGYNIVFTIALIAGLIAISMIRKIPEYSSTTRISHEHFPKFLNLVKEPLSNKNFKKYLIFSTMFGAGSYILAPFLVIYMNKTLMLSKTLISTYTIIWSIAYIIFMKIWGYFADKFGNKPILTISAWGAAISTFLWLFATHDSYIIIPIIYFVKGIFFSGFFLASMNLLLNITPAQHKSMYISNYQFIRSFFIGLSPIVGGYILMINLSSFHINLSNIHFLCILSGSISLFAALLLTRVETCKEKSTVYVLKRIISLNPIKTIVSIFLPYHSSKKDKDSQNNSGEINGQIR